MHSILLANKEAWQIRILLKFVTEKKEKLCKERRRKKTKKRFVS